MKRILIIDDDDQVRSMLRRFFERQGYAVAEAENGRVGRRMFEAEPADVVICDLMMPKEEGIETIRHLAAGYPGIRIIAISGGSLNAERYLAFASKLGAQRVHEKPFVLRDLLRSVEELLAEAPPAQ